MLVRTDNAGCTHAVLDWLHGQRLSYSVGFTLPEDTPDLLVLDHADVVGGGVGAGVPGSEREPI